MSTRDLRQRLRSSFVYDAYWSLRAPETIMERDSEVVAYRNILSGFPAGGLVFDIGANHGYKADIFLRLGASVVAVDPDPECQQLLSGRFHRFRRRKLPVTIVGSAVSDSVSRAELWIDAPGSAKNTLSTKWVSTLRGDSKRFGSSLSFGQRRQVETTTIKALIDAHGSPYFIKIDVEGYEQAVIAGMAEPVPFVSYEVNLPEFRDEGRACLELLRRLDPESTFNYCVRLSAGCVLDEWVPFQQFDALLQSLGDSSIEVFCHSHAAMVSGSSGIDSDQHRQK